MTEEELQALQDTNKGLVERVNQLESINSSLVDQKKELKQKLEEGYSNDDMKKELDNYRSQLEKAESEKSELEQSYSEKLNGLKMMNSLRDLNIEAHNTDALMEISRLALDGAKPNDDGFVYLNEDGTTKFNDANKDYSVLDRINELREGNKSYLFKQATGGGGGQTPPSTPKDTKPDINEIINRGLKY